MPDPLCEHIAAWAAKWADRESWRFAFENYQPKLFSTRRAAREWIKSNYGYIRERPDLRAAPHFWNVPIAVKVIVTIKETPHA